MKSAPNQIPADDAFRVVIGPPGCGKTHHVLKCAAEAAERFGTHSVLLASLTRTAAAEIRQRGVELPREAVGTLHAHAFRALGRPRLVVGSEVKDWNETAPCPWWCIGRGLSESQLEEGALDAELPADSRGDQLLATSTLMRSRMLPTELWPDQEACDFNAAFTRWKMDRGLMDFQDLIDRALKTIDCAPGNPRIIYLDEAQDHSRAELELALKWGHAAKALVAVGDADQAIFTWRGANPERFLSMASPEHRRVLSQSYRLPRAVHAHAVEWINGTPNREPVHYEPRDDEGEVVENECTSCQNPEWVVDDAWNRMQAGQSCMILASCSYMLEKTKHELMRRGIPFHNPYRRTRGDWNPLAGARRLVDYLRPSELAWGDGVKPWTWETLWSWIELVDSRYLMRGVKAQIKAMAADERTCGESVHKTLGDRQMPKSRSVSEFDEEALSPSVLYTPSPEIGDLEAIYREAAESVRVAMGCFGDGIVAFDGRPGTVVPLLLERYRKRMEYPVSVAERCGAKALKEEPRLVLGTIHSVKGGESDAVYVFPNLSPAADDAVEVRRLFYVAFTRARESLILCGGQGKRAW